MRTSQPLVSIITPCFNAAPFLEETWESIRRQTYSKWEWVVADDGSTDGSLEVLHGIGARDPRVRVIAMPGAAGQGAAAARNCAAEAAKGSFLAFQDADDLWRPEKLEKQVKHLEQHPKVAAVCSWYSVFGDQMRCAVWSQMLWRYATEVVTVDQILNQVPATPTVLMRRDFYQQLGGMRVSPQLRAGEDKEFFLRLVLQHPMHRLCEELTEVRLHAPGRSLSTINLHQSEVRERAIIEGVKEAGLVNRELEKKLLAQLYYTLAKDALFHHGGPFRRNLLRSIKTFHAPPKAWLMASLAFLPRPALKRVLFLLLAARNPRTPS